jgi:hypothetical protein
MAGHRAARISLAFLGLSVGIALGLPAHALRVDNFVLLDQAGVAHELYYQSDASAVVIMIQGNGCPVVRNALADFKALRTSYAPRNVRFFMLNANLQDNRDSIRAEAEAWDIDVPILDDETQLIGESLSLVRTAEVLVLDPATWELVYRGPINDRLNYERQKTQASEHFLANTLDTMLTGKTVEVGERNTIGCLINFPGRTAKHAGISYSETIAPLLKEKCAVCHRPGGIGPWAMTGHAMVQGFAPMIREVVRTRRMPPWHADPHVGNWLDDRRLSPEQTQTLVHWIEAGAVRGSGPDPLEDVTPIASDWPLGEPDLVIDMPRFEVPASGVVDYQFPAVKNPLDRGVWVKAATILPGDRTVVHHVLAGASDIAPDADRESVFDNYIMGYAPGAESALMPEGTGVFIPPGGYYLFQLHYTPTGKAAVDETRMGLYFADQTPDNFLRHQVVLDPTINIPPNAARHEEAAYFEFHKDARLFSLFPHAHYRGRSSSFEVRYPDGRTDTVLSVPNYDFNWQRGYDFVEPMVLPAGSRLIHRTVYDNSARNPGNPDPERTVPWGLQSWDEMLYGAFSYSWVDESSATPTHDRQRSQLTQWVGFLDRDMDGKLVWSELPRHIKKRLVQGFKMVDKNGDGGLDIEEFIAMQRQNTASSR